MAYLKVIESNQTWTCPKTGLYKIICVSGGSTGKAVINLPTISDSFKSASGSELIYSNLIYDANTCVKNDNIITIENDGTYTQFGDYLTSSGYEFEYGGNDNIIGDLSDNSIGCIYGKNGFKLNRTLDIHSYWSTGSGYGASGGIEYGVSVTGNNTIGGLKSGLYKDITRLQSGCAGKISIAIEKISLNEKVNCVVGIGSKAFNTSISIKQQFRDGSSDSNIYVLNCNLNMNFSKGNNGVIIIQEV